MLTTNRLNDEDNPISGDTPLIIHGPYLGFWHFENVRGDIPSGMVGGFARSQLTLRAAPDSEGPSSCTVVNTRSGVRQTIEVFLGAGTKRSPIVQGSEWITISFDGKTRGKARYFYDIDSVPRVKAILGVAPTGGYVTRLEPGDFEKAFPYLDRVIIRDFAPYRPWGVWR